MVRRRVPALPGHPDRHRSDQAGAHRHAPCPAYRQGRRQLHRCHPFRALAHRSGPHQLLQASAHRAPRRAHCPVHPPDRHRFRHCVAAARALGSCPANQVLRAPAPSAPAPRRCPPAGPAQFRPGATRADGAARANRGAATRSSPSSGAAYLGLRPAGSNAGAS